MNIKDSKLNEMIAYEAFIRRASELELPFMLKGSYVTRQYYPKPEMRTPMDLDWLYMENLTDVDEATTRFNEWAIAVTELEGLDDNAQYLSFSNNAFWRSIEYAMHDDFPTVNTDLDAFVNGKRQDLYIDVSFDHQFQFPAESLYYTPIYGEPFIVPYAVPLALQISWKMHQTIVRPRFKDLIDLIYLIGHETYTSETKVNVLQALVDECHMDRIRPAKIKLLFKGAIRDLYKHADIDESWNHWISPKREHNPYFMPYQDKAHHMVDTSLIPNSLDDFIAFFNEKMDAAGLGKAAFKELPEPSQEKK